jgi:hypothetical protein
MQAGLHQERMGDQRFGTPEETAAEAPRVLQRRPGNQSNSKKINVGKTLQVRRGVMRKVWRGITTAVLGLTLSGGVAQAGTLTTPLIAPPAPEYANDCTVINVSNQPVTVTVEVIGLFSSQSNSTTCTIPPGDLKDFCAAFLQGPGFCKVTSPLGTDTLRKAVRAVLMTSKTTAPFQIEAIIEAR